MLIKNYPGVVGEGEGDVALAQQIVPLRLHLQQRLNQRERQLKQSALINATLGPGGRGAASLNFKTVSGVEIFRKVAGEQKGEPVDSSLCMQTAGAVNEGTGNSRGDPGARATLGPIPEEGRFRVSFFDSPLDCFQLGMTNTVAGGAITVPPS